MNLNNSLGAEFGELLVVLSIHMQIVFNKLIASLRSLFN